MLLACPISNGASFYMMNPPPLRLAASHLCPVAPTIGIIRMRGGIEPLKELIAAERKTGAVLIVPGQLTTPWRSL